MQKVHEGHNIKRIREMLGVKQEALAYKLGNDWNQKKVSLMEGKESVEAELMDQVAEALGVPAEAIKNFNEEAAIYNIQHNYEGSNTTSSNLIGNNYTFNPIDKWVEAVEENKKLYAALLKEKDEKIALLERLLEGK